MNLIVDIKTMIETIKNYKKDVVLCGLSSRTKSLIATYNLEDKISYILDNDTQKLATKYLSIEIINQKKLETLDTPLIVISGNYISLFYNQVKTIPTKNIVIETQKHLTPIQNLSNLLDTNLIFEIETPNYKIINEENNSHKFIPKLINHLLKLNINIQTKQVYSNNESYFEPRKSKPNSFLLSYHSIGEKLPNILRYKDGYLNNMITFDSKGHSGWSSLCGENIEEILCHINHTKATQFFHQLKKNHIQKNQSKYTQPNEDNFPFPKKFIFFPLQTVSDSVMLHSYFNPIELLQNIVQILHKKKIALVVKRHPRCENSELAKLLTQYEKEKKIIIFNGSIHQAIAKADTIYTINSGVGFESLLHLKPVVTFGKSDYMSMTKNITSLDAIEKNPLYRLTKEIKSKIKSFVYYYATEKSIFIDDEKQIEKFIDTIIKNYLKGEINV